MTTRQPTPGVHENFAADVAETKPQPLGYITPAALEQLRLGIDCQPIHKDTRHGFTVPIFDHPPRMPEPITPPPPQSHLMGDPALIGIAEEVKGSGGHWQPCTGCYDTEDGDPTQEYAYSPALQTDIGCGCHECGGLGAVWWHMTDEQVADFAKICEEVDTEHQLKMRVVRLEAGLRRFRRAYVSLMESGRDRIISLGGSCDPVDVMEAGDPELRLIDAALATTEGSDNG